QPACTDSGPGVLSVTTPPNGNVAPPGYYMLFVLDSDGVPSKARFIQLAAHASAPPHGTISSPASDMSVLAGGPLRFPTTAPAAGYSWVFPGGSPGASTAQNPTVPFSTPGDYFASLTVTDGTGTSDPSPPTRRIRVLPASPDFLIQVVPTSRAILPGQST